RTSAADRVRLHAARVRAALQEPAGLPADRGHAAERPRRGDLDVVPAPAERVERRLADAILDGDVPRPRRARVERARKRLGVMARRVDGRLEVEIEVDVREERLERPLILLVAARRPEGEIRVAAASDERPRERRPRTLAPLERAREPVLQREHLRARAEAEPQLGNLRLAAPPAGAPR